MMNQAMALQNPAGSLACIVGLALVGSGCGSTTQSPKEQSGPPAFNPTVAVRCQMTVQSDGQNLAVLFQSAIEETIREKRRVTVVDDPASARLLLDATFFLKQGSTGGQFNHRFRIVDTEHDIVVFEEAMTYLGAPYTDSEAVEMVRGEFKKLAKYLEKSISASNQVELGRNGVAYLEGSLRKGAQANYFRFDHDKSSRRVYIEYPLDSIGSGLAGIATTTTVDKVYDIAEKQELELAATAEQADVRIEVVGSTGGSQSYARVLDGNAAPAATDSGAAMRATIRVFAKNETEPQLEITVSADGPTASKLQKSPQEIAIENFKSALGKEIGKVSSLLETIE